MGGEDTIVLSVLLANHTVWVRQFTRFWKHSDSCVTRPRDLLTSCSALQTNPFKKTLLKGNTNKILLLLTLLVRDALYYPLCFLWREAYLWTIIWHHVHIPPTRCSLVICCVCPPPPCYVSQWVAFFLWRSPPPPPLPSTHKHIDHVTHKVHSADGDGCLWVGRAVGGGVGGWATTWLWVWPLTENHLFCQRGKQTMLCGPYRGSLPFLLKALTPSCLSTLTKLWTIVPCMPALVTILPR